MLVYLAGALVCLVAVARLLPEGVGGALAAAVAAGKLRVIGGLVLSLCVGELAPYVLGVPGIAWTWNVAVGTVVTFAVGLAVSRIVGPARVPVANG